MFCSELINFHSKSSFYLIVDLLLLPFQDLLEDEFDGAGIAIAPDQLEQLEIVRPKVNVPQYMAPIASSVITTTGSKYELFLYLCQMPFY